MKGSHLYMWIIQTLLSSWLIIEEGQDTYSQAHIRKVTNLVGVSFYYGHV